MGLRSKSLASDSSWNVALQATMTPEGWASYIGSPDRRDVPTLDLRKSAGFDESFYKSRGRGSPTLRDLEAKQQSGGQSALCICELCDCGKHSCPVHGTGKKASKPRPKFDANSTYRADFTPKNIEDLSPAASTIKHPKQYRAFDGESSTRRDFTPPPQGAYPQQSNDGTKSVPNRVRPKFDGQSVMRRDFTPPPRAAQDGSTASATKTKTIKSRPPFDAMSTYDSDFTNKWGKDVSGKPRCQASILLERKPPTPGSGREHIYWDPAKKKWT